MTQSELKRVASIGAELGAAKAEVERLRGLLHGAHDTIRNLAEDLDEEEFQETIDQLAEIELALAPQQAEPKCSTCNDVGIIGHSEVCPDCADTWKQQAEPTDTFTAVEMATAAAQGFRDWHKAEPAPAQDEMVVYRAVNQFGSDCHFGIESLARVWAGAKGSVERVALKPVPELSLVESRPAQDERETFEQAFVIQEGVYWSEDHQSYLSMNGRAIEDRDAIDATMWWTGWKARAALARPAQTEQQPIGYACQADLEWEDEPIRICRERFRDWQLPVYAAPIAQTEQQPAFLLEIGADGEYAVQVRDKDWLRSMRNKREHQTHNLYSAPIAQTAPQGKFRMGDLVKKSTGSEWVGRVVGWYSTEQTKEGYAVESSAHRNSVQIYPAKALEAVE